MEEVKGERHQPRDDRSAAAHLTHTTQQSPSLDIKNNSKNGMPSLGVRRKECKPCTVFTRAKMVSLHVLDIIQNMYPLYKAIELIQSLNKAKTDIDVFEAIEISSLLLARYGNNIESSISSIRICQDGERVYFEFTKDKYIADYLKDRIITRTDLGFIVENCEDRVFKPNNHIGVNVNKFLDLDDYSMLNCVGEIFTQEWIEKQLTRIK